VAVVRVSVTVIIGEGEAHLFGRTLLVVAVVRVSVTVIIGEGEAHLFGRTLLVVAVVRVRVTVIIGEGDAHHSFLFGRTLLRHRQLSGGSSNSCGNSKQV